MVAVMVEVLQRREVHLLSAHAARSIGNSCFNTRSYWPSDTPSRYTRMFSGSAACRPFVFHSWRRDLSMFFRSDTKGGVYVISDVTLSSSRISPIIGTRYAHPFPDEISPG